MCVSLSFQDTVSRFKQQVSEHLGVMRTYLGVLEASLGREAERVQHQATDALQNERKVMTRYLDQLKQMETVLGEVQDEPQTEFLRVRHPTFPPHSSSCALCTIKPIWYFDAEP